MITDPLFYAVAIPAVIIVGMAKAGFASSLGLVGVPLLALIISPVQAAGIMLPILIAMDVFALFAYRRVYDKTNLRIIIPGAAIGIFIGWLTAAYVSEGHVRLIVGVIALAFTIDYWLGWRGDKVNGPDVAKGTFWSAIAGFTSFVSHAGSPPLQMYMLPQRLEPRLLVGTTVIFFAAVNMIKVIPYFFLDQLNSGNLATSAVLAPLAPLAIWVGYKLVHIVKAETFYRIAYICIFIVSLKLIWDGSKAALG